MVIKSWWPNHIVVDGNRGRHHHGRLHYSFFIMNGNEISSEINIISWRSRTCVGPFDLDNTLGPSTQLRPGSDLENPVRRVWCFEGRDHESGIFICFSVWKTPVNGCRD